MKLSSLTLLCALALAQPVHAASLCGDTASCLQAIEAGQRSMQVLSARFRQTKYVSLLNEPIVTEGRFALRPPDSVLWQVGDPPLTIRMDKSGVELPEAVKREAGDGARQLSAALQRVAGLLSGSVQSLRGPFDVEARPDGDAVVVHLAPRDAGVRDLFSSVDMVFAAPHFHVASVKLEEALGDRLEISFFDVHIDDADAAAMLPAR